MERTKPKKSAVQANALHTLASQLVTRMNLATSLGFQYNGARDIYKALGYTVDLKFDDYLARYLRQDIAKAIIDRPVNATWQGELELIETDDAKETPFEKAWRKLNWALDVKGVLQRVDRLAGIGQYGVILLGLDDCTTIEAFKNPVKAGKRKLHYLKPFSEKTAKISTYEENTKNERFGKPLLYELQIADPSSSKNATALIHYSRVIHIVENSLESETLGRPRLEAVYNRLMDLDKIVGGDAEMFWRGARPGYQGVVEKDYTVTPQAEAEFQAQVDEYENFLRRIIVNEGITLKELAVQISDPAPHVSVCVQMISAQTGIPQRVLTGSERGELASTQDSGEWKTYVQTRRENFAEPCIVRPVVEAFVKYGILPEYEDSFEIDWEDLFAISEKERVEIGKGRANALREYTYNPMAAAIVPPEGFLEYFLGFDRQQIELMKRMKSDDILEEVKELMEIQNGPEEKTTESKETE